MRGVNHHDNDGQVRILYQHSIDGSVLIISLFQVARHNTNLEAIAFIQMLVDAYNQQVIKAAKHLASQNKAAKPTEDKKTKSISDCERVEPQSWRLGARNGRLTSGLKLERLTPTRPILCGFTTRLRLFLQEFFPHIQLPASLGSHSVRPSFHV
jgi:hypothetical protein